MAVIYLLAENLPLNSSIHVGERMRASVKVLPVKCILHMSMPENYLTLIIFQLRSCLFFILLLFSYTSLYGRLEVNMELRNLLMLSKSRNAFCPSLMKASDDFRS